MMKRFPEPPHPHPPFIMQNSHFRMCMYSMGTGYPHMFITLQHCSDDDILMKSLKSIK